MSHLLSIQTDKNLGRDVSTNGVINTNPNEYEKYLSQRKQKEDDMKAIHSMREDIHSLKNDLLELKQLILGMDCHGK